MSTFDSQTNWASRFEGPLAPLAPLIEAMRDGTERIGELSAEFAHRPEVAPLWFRARLWAPLPREAWRRHEQTHGYTIAPGYEPILAQLNGACVFKLLLYGMPPSMLQDPPLLNRSGFNPLDLGIAQQHWKREEEAPDAWFLFGSSMWRYDANIHYLLDDAGVVHGWVDGAEARCWSNLTEFFAEELLRAQEAFPAHEAWFAKLRRDSDRPQARAKRWLKGLLGR